MKDLIYRQDAIDLLDVLCQEHRYKIPGKFETYSPYNEAWQDALDRAEGEIFNLPSVQQEQRWIPCSERLPEEREWIGTKRFGTTISDTVLITFNAGGTRFVKPLSLQNGELSRADKRTMDVFYPGWEMVAWMPLPEPYKEEE